MSESHCPRRRSILSGSSQLFDYKELWRQLLARDSRTCQICSLRTNSQVHHQKLRSQQDSDEDSYLITLCAGCHAQLHGILVRTRGQG
jgi:5-methylcytosine-specific restriction endonuclease McrA